MDIEQLLRSALERYELVMGEKLPTAVDINVDPSDDFLAFVHLNHDGIKIEISNGVMSAITKLWHEAFALSETLPEENRLNAGHVDDAIEASLEWLILHELTHALYRHLELVGAHGIAETDQSTVLGLTSRANIRRPKLSRIDRNKAVAIQRYLELQADYYALDVMTAEHIIDRHWDNVRFYLACAMAVMALIDKYDIASDEDRSHPKAATRAFQMFAAVTTAQAPMLKAAKQRSDDIHAFHNTVIAPVISDFSILAKVLGIRAMVHSQQYADNIMFNIATLSRSKDYGLGDLNTEAAKEYELLMQVSSEVEGLLNIESYAI